MLSRTLDPTALQSMRIPIAAPRQAPNELSVQRRQRPLIEVGDAERCVDNVLVAVRVRPRGTGPQVETKNNKLSEKHRSLVSVSGSSLRIENPKSYNGLKTHSFTYDRCYPGEGENGGTSQKMIFDDLGDTILANAFDGYNVTTLAYGQTGSGKSFTMMGHQAEAGLIPRICKNLIHRAESKKLDTLGYDFKLEASFLEIYCERVKDLLDPQNGSGGGGLHVREHPTTGPYCEDLSVVPVASYSDVESLMSTGNSARTVAATKMNMMSSRSHAIFTLTFTQSVSDDQLQTKTDKISKIHLVDLAGSERSNRSLVRGKHQREATEINKSLMTLGRVIKALADASVAHRQRSPSSSSPLSSPSRLAKTMGHVPFRDSVLTWLLKGSFGVHGNARTIMLCTISPEVLDYEETLSTLRYANNAKKVVNKAVVNEDSTQKLISQLRGEINELSQKLGSTQRSSRNEISELTEQLSLSKKLINSLNESWEDKLQRAEKLKRSREDALRSEGIAIKMESNVAFLCNLDENPSSSECLLYPLRLGTTEAGFTTTSNSSPSNSSSAHILLNDAKLPPLLVSFHNNGRSVVIRAAPDANEDAHSLVRLNGSILESERELCHGDRLILGERLAFRFNEPYGSEQAQNLDWGFAQREMNAKLEAIEADLLKERENVRLLQSIKKDKEGEMLAIKKELEREKKERKTDVEGHRRLSVIEQEKLKRQLRLMQSEVDKHRLNFRDEFSPRKKIASAFRLSLSQSPSPLSLAEREHSLAAQESLAALMSVVRARRNSDFTSDRQKLEATLRATLLYVDEANAMAHALGHEVEFEVCVDIGVEVSSDAVLLSALTQMRLLSDIRIRVRMCSTYESPIIQSRSEFLNLCYELRELYAFSYEHRSHSRIGEVGVRDPIECLQSHGNEALEVGVAHLKYYRIEEQQERRRVTIAVLASTGHPVGCIMLTLLGSSVSSNEFNLTLNGIEMYGDAYDSVQVRCCFWDPDVDLAVNDVPLWRGQDKHWDAPAPTLSLPLASLFTITQKVSDGSLSPSISFYVSARLKTPTTVDVSDTVHYRHSAYQQVSILRAPVLGADGTLSAPQLSERCSRAKQLNTEDAKARRSKGFIRSSSLGSRMSEGHMLYITIDIEELDSKGSFVPCDIKSLNGEAGATFRLRPERPKRFHISIVQSDTQPFILESCTGLRVSALRFGPAADLLNSYRPTLSAPSMSKMSRTSFGELAVLEDSEAHELDIMHQSCNVHHRHLSLSSSWPIELSHHSYIGRSTQQGARICIDIEMQLYVCWQEDPILIQRSLLCKADTGGLGSMRRLLRRRSGPAGARHVPGTYCSLLPRDQTRLAASLIAKANKDYQTLLHNFNLELSRQRLLQERVESPARFGGSDAFALAVLESMMDQRARSRLPPATAAASASLSLQSTPKEPMMPIMANSVKAERSGFLLMRVPGSKSWRRFLFTLRRPMLYYYADSRPDLLQGIFSLVGCSVASLSLGAGCTAAAGEPSPPYTLLLQTQTKSVELQASNEDDLQHWAQLISSHHRLRVL